MELLLLKAVVYAFVALIAGLGIALWLWRTWG